MAMNLPIWAIIKPGHVRSCLYNRTVFCLQHTKAAARTSVASQQEADQEKSQIKREDLILPPKDDKEKFPINLKQKETLASKLLTALKIKSKPENVKKAKVEITPKQQGSSVIFTDEEPIDFQKDNLVRLDAKDPSLWHWQDEKIDWKKLPKHYLMLSKSRLTLLVSITSAAGYGLACSSFDPVIFTISTLGVALTSASANTVNQILEVPFDSQMNRTRNRVLVKGMLTPWHAFGFALASGASGALILYQAVNPLASMLAVTNLLLYTSVYTPMKRLSIYNTWVGSVVGALPPLIGWVSATGTLDLGALVLGGILYTWQFPHFNSLSWNLRPDYSRAGYRMMSVTDPDLCKRVALR